MKAAIQAVDVMLHRDGVLILTHGSGHVVIPGRGGQHGGGPISAESAETIKKRRDCVEISSGLFPRCAQSWKLVRQKSGSVLRPGQIAPLQPMDPSAPGVRAADVPVVEGVGFIPPDDPSDGFETAAAQLHPNKVDISRQLFQLFSPAFVKKYPDARVEIAYANMAGSEKPDEAETFSAFDLQKAADFAEMKSKAGFNIYVGAALRRDECRGRADVGDFVDASRAWADFDKHGDDARVDLLLKEKNLQPSEIVQTGSTPHRRFQIYLRHADSVTKEQSRDANTALKTWLGGDKVHSPVHLMRLAGSINYPSKKKREERGYVPELVQLHLKPDAPGYTIEQLTGTAPRRQGYGETPETPAPTRESFFKEVNQLALLRLSTWVKPLFGEKVKFYASTGAWRITSKDLGRNLEEDLSISQRGVWDYGTEQASSPIQLVIEYGPRKPLVETTAADAALWLCERMGIDPELLGWGTRERRSADDAGYEGVMTSTMRPPDRTVSPQSARPPTSGAIPRTSRSANFSMELISFGNLARQSLRPVVWVNLPSR
jgi:hypothetical protein